MKKITIFCLCLLICSSVFAMTSARPAKHDDAFNAFWQKFKTAVVSGDKSAVARLSLFPIGMSYGIRSIKNGVELKRRYREVFNKQTDAAQCFAQKEPVADADNAKRFSVGCPDSAGNEVVIYEFERTKTGWRFVRLDNINE